MPVPLHPNKQQQREFNQAERLARRLGRAAHLPVCHRVLRRVRPTLSQTKLSRADRARNVRQAFVLQQARPVKKKRVLLVDDVFTTGATTDACARLLRQAGACEVGVWTIARGMLR